MTAIYIELCNAHNVMQMIKTEQGYFNTEDRLIALLTDDTGVIVYVKKSLLISHSTYFKNVFSDVSSNKDEDLFRSYVTEKSTLMYVNYLQTGKLTLAMCDDDIMWTR